MSRVFGAITVCATLVTCFLPTVAPAGGPPPMQRKVPSAGPVSIRRSFQAIPAFSPQGAFGSPGGFPLPFPPSHRVRPVRVPPHKVFPRFPVASALYAPSAFYAPSALYESPVDASPPAVYVAPTINVSPIVYVTPPAVSSPGAATPPAAPSLPYVVEFPTGRYELRGDGATTPYAWVWVPNPPTSPPVTPAAPEEPRAGSAPATARSEVYRWADDEGTTFLTNRVEKVPAALRSRLQTAP